MVKSAHFHHEMFQSRKRFRHCWSPFVFGATMTDNAFQSRKRFRHCWSVALAASQGTGTRFQSRKRFRHCWSPAQSLRNRPQVLGFNRESDSVTVGACYPEGDPPRFSTFQSRKRFRHCWSATLDSGLGDGMDVSIAKAIPSLLELS